MLLQNLLQDQTELFMKYKVLDIMGVCVCVRASARACLGYPLCRSHLLCAVLLYVARVALQCFSTLFPTAWCSEKKSYEYNVF